MLSFILLLLGSLFLLVCLIIIGSAFSGKSAQHKIPAKLPSEEWIPGTRRGYQKTWTFEDKMIQDIQQQKKLARQLHKAQTEKSSHVHNVQEEKQMREHLR